MPRTRTTLYARELVLAAFLFCCTASLGAQTQAAAPVSVLCVSESGTRARCEADTKSGVALARSVGTQPCTLGKTWGYDQDGIWVSDGCAAVFDLGRAKTPFGEYTPLRGFKVAATDRGELSFKLYAYVRYLNQLSLDDTTADAFGDPIVVRRRQDMQFQKINIQFLGWLLNPRFRYFAYTWSSNTSQGLGAQVVVGGHLQYVFNERVTVGGGVNALPGVRATEGNFPLWLGVDNRLMADEFFRPSYTMGAWLRGAVVDRLHYFAMVGNNLSQLGIDAGQLDNRFNTWSGALVWMPTTGEFGAAGAFGDFDGHRKVATRLGAHYTFSVENFQAHTNSDAFENVQIRLSDGSNIFTPDLFGDSVRVTDARYQMASADLGVKYRGFALEGEYYWRSVDEFRGERTGALASLWDHGFQVQGSAMVIPQLAQLYVSGSTVFGQYGEPSDFRAGANWFPFRSQVIRLNAEYLRLRRSPVGGLSLPYVVGGNGPVFYTSFEVNF